MANATMQSPIDDKMNDGLMPLKVRRVLLAMVGMIVALAVYLTTVRGSAMLLDLAAMTTNMFCF